jgi:hypothetical protein
VEDSRQNHFLFYFEKTAQNKQPPNRQKFSPSGRPDSEIGICLFIKTAWIGYRVSGCVHMYVPFVTVIWAL